MPEVKWLRRKEPREWQDPGIFQLPRRGARAGPGPLRTRMPGFAPCSGHEGSSRSTLPVPVPLLATVGSIIMVNLGIASLRGPSPAPAQAARPPQARACAQAPLCFGRREPGPASGSRGRWRPSHFKFEPAGRPGGRELESGEPSGGPAPQAR